MHELSLALPWDGIEHWNHEQFRRLASSFGIAPEFNIVALPESVDDQVSQESEESSVEPCSNVDNTGKYYDAEQFMAEFGHSILSKLPGLRRMTIDYSHEFQLFDRFSHFPHLMEVNIWSGYIFDGNVGDNQFDDALRLLGLPKLQKWSLTCSGVIFAGAGNGDLLSQYSSRGFRLSVVHSSELKSVSLDRESMDVPYGRGRGRGRGR